MSKQANAGRPWTAEEDRLLTDAVRIYGDNTEKWKTIALSVPGRTNKACRKRWLHSLSPTVKKSAWTTEEDQLLLSLFAKYPNKWSQIARSIPGRTDDACSKRYREALDPKLKKDEWTDEEDMRLLEVFTQRGGPSNPKWGLIGQDMGRSGLGCRNRWRLLERKKNALYRQPPRISAEQASEPPQLLGDVWPGFIVQEPSVYFTSPWEHISLVNTSSVDLSTDFDVLGLSAGQLMGLHESNLLSDQSDMRPLDGQSATVMPGVTFTFTSSSLNDALTSSRAETHEARNGAGINTSSSGMQVTHSPPIDISLTSDAAESMSIELTENELNNIRSPSTISDASESLPVLDEGNGPTSGEAVYQSQHAYHESPSNSSPSGRTVTGCVSETVPPWRRLRTGIDATEGAGVRLVTLQSIGEQKPPKLSSKLPVSSNPTVLAYVCGHSHCWKENSTSAACFSTSGELMNHYKEQHMFDMNGVDETPFRCGLQGCSKGWKSINGLQYHLQVSKAHYRRALTTVASQKDATCNISSNSVAAKKQKVHKCPHSDCVNEYKQLSGLRYHLLHGHPKNPPTQLDFVPPTIARTFGLEAEITIS